MTAEERIQWVALPAGSSDGLLHLSVLVAPRLRTDEGDTLEQFPHFVDWPARLAGADWSVQVAGNRVAATPTGDPPESALWTALFPPDTTVVPFVHDDFADRPMVTFSVGEVAEQLRQLYAAAAAAGPDRLPPLQSSPGVEPPVLGLDRLLRDFVDAVHGPLFDVTPEDPRTAIVGRLLDRARSEARGRRAGIRGGPPVEPVRRGEATELERLVLFHSRAQREPSAMPTDGDHYLDVVDFHQMVGAVSDHGWLARRLGLVVDLTVDAADVPPALQSAPGVLSVSAGLAVDPLGHTLEVCPDTAYVHQDVTDVGVFFAAALSAPDPLAPPDAPPTGLVALPESQFSVEQVDVDGAALKSLNLAVTVAQPATPPAQRPDHQPADAGLPAVRSSGMAIVHSGRAAALQNEFLDQLDANTAVGAGAPHTLFAEQLVRGYRLDVLDTTTGSWRSLHHCRTSAVATRFDGALGDVEDERFFSVGLASPPVAPGAVPDPAAELYVHETLVTWDGWSLSAPRPGASLSRDPRAPDADQPDTLPTKVTNDPYTQMGLRVSADSVRGTLPRLRFGRAYRFRLRTVDLAGNGPTPDQADLWLASPATSTPALPGSGAPYLRFEPVAAPVVVPAMRFGEGASLHRLVIRSNRGLEPGAYAAWFNALPEVLEEGHDPYSGFDDRHLAPPKTSYEMAEKHGAFDPVMGADPLLPPDPAVLADIRAAYELARREKGSFDDPSVPGAEVVEIDAGHEHPQRYVIHHADQLELPYLPDPLATGVVLLGVPGLGPGESMRLSFDAQPWHQAHPFRLRLLDGSGPPEWDPAVRLLTVRLPEAGSARIRVASVLERLDLMGILGWCERVLDGPELDRVYEAAKDNRCWLTTPWHDLELVHAVQQPREDPHVETLEVERSAGAPYADLYGEVKLDVASTEKIDVVASWSEQVDDPASPRPEQVQGSATVFDLSVQTAASIPDGHPHDDPYTLIDRAVLTFATNRARSLGLATPKAHAFGDTKHRRVTYQVVATTPYREDFPPHWSDRPELLTALSEPVVLDVPSSAPPTAPDLLYVVPTQGWERSEAAGTTTVVRRGGGLRVWLGRRWWSSGDGELLGVVLTDALLTPTSVEYPVATILGRDPIRTGAPLELPTAAMLSGQTVVVRGQTLLEMAEHRPAPVPTPRFTVVGYEPTFDEDSGRWFCDLRLDTEGAYLPFVRLALVRYQAQALPGCAVSRVVLADLTQTLPDRTATLTRSDDGTVALSVSGPSYASTRGTGHERADGDALSRMHVRVERREPGIPDPDLAWSPVEGTEVAIVPVLDGFTATWDLGVPVPEAVDGADRRLMVFEEERLAVDAQTPNDDGLAGRVVYATTFDL